MGVKKIGSAWAKNKPDFGADVSMLLIEAATKACVSDGMQNLNQKVQIHVQ